jgi:glycosyltransferase involved in cell wall biosynthesis
MTNAACNPMISVVTVCFNESSERIRYTLNSILDQNYENIELVVIDGGSRSTTIDALSLYRKRFKIFISEPDDGIFDAMNKGIMSASGEWLVFMNIGDAFYDNYVITAVVDDMRIGSEIVYGNVIHKKDGLRVPPRRISKYRLLLGGICHQAMFISRGCFEQIGVYDASRKVSGDPDWNLRACMAGFQFQYLNRAIAIYDGTGISADTKLQNDAKNYLRRKYLTSREFVLFNVLELLFKIAGRLRTFNFTRPVSCKNLSRGAKL